MRSASTPLPGSLVQAAELRQHGRRDDAVALLEVDLSKARAKPLDTPFLVRVQLGLALADLHLATGRRGRAIDLLRTEAAFAEQIERLVRETGSPEQVRAASVGGLRLRDRVSQLTLIGRSAPAIEVADWVLGTPTTLAEQRGKVVLLEFWAHWCRPCLAMFPVLNGLHDRYAEDGLTIIALTRYVGGNSGSDRTADRARQHDAISQSVAHRGLRIAVGIAPDGRLQQTYGAGGIPAVALIDRAGTVTPAPPASEKVDLEAAIASLLSAPARPGLSAERRADPATDGATVRRCYTEASAR